MARRWPAVLLIAGSIACRRPGPAFVEARAVVAQHCVPCHSDRTTIPAFPIAGGGVELDTVAQMQRYAERIKIRVVMQRNMPLLNVTGMTDAERALLGAWVDSGARGP
jgi:uncharacterized membrane protein